MLDLRDYQLETLKKISALYQRDIRRQLIILPTGSGKTVVFSHLSKRFGKPTLVLAHREELLLQAKDKIEMIWPEVDVGIVQANKDEFDKQVVVASIQTLSRPERLNRLKKKFGLVIADESHHSTSPSWRTVLTALGCFEKDGPLTVGFTATPNRSDNVGLGEIFEEVAYQRSILDMMEDGYLSDVRAIRINTQVDLSGVKVIAGDYDENELARRVNNTERNNIIVKAFLEHCTERTAVAFCANIAHAEDLANLFRQHGVTSEAVSSKIPNTKRRQILESFHKGEIQVLTNNNLLIEGWDEPRVNAVIMARPTQSESFFIQMVGRGLRLFPGKQDCVILDITDNTIQHNVLSTPRIFGMTETDAERMSREGTSVLSEKTREQLKILGKADVTYSVEDLDIFAGSIFSWIFNGKSYFLVLPDDEMIALHPDDKDNTKFHTIYYRGIQTRCLTKSPMPVEWAQGQGEQWVRRNRVESLKVLRRDLRWINEPASEGQLNSLRKAKKDIPNGLKKGQASRMISMLIANKKEIMAKAEIDDDDQVTENITPGRKKYLLDLLRDRHIKLKVDMSIINNEVASEIIKTILAKGDHPLIENPRPVSKGEGNTKKS